MTPAATWGQHRIALDLGETTPLGYTLTIDTCTGTGFDSQLMFAYGCPSTLSSYGCVLSNDNTAGCGTGSQSRITVSAVQRWSYVVVQGTSGAFGAYNLSWSYALPTPSNSQTRSITASRTPSGAWHRLRAPARGRRCRRRAG